MYKCYYNGHISSKLGNVKMQKFERRQVLNDAVADEVITKSPADSVKALKETGAKATETYHRALTEQGKPIEHFTAPYPDFTPNL